MDRKSIADCRVVITVYDTDASVVAVVGGEFYPFRDGLFAVVAPWGIEHDEPVRRKGKVLGEGQRDLSNGSKSVILEIDELLGRDE